MHTYEYILYPSQKRIILGVSSQSQLPVDAKPVSCGSPNCLLLSSWKFYSQGAQVYEEVCENI
jgi:hypothetical protein